MEWINQANDKAHSLNEIISFYEFYEELKKNPTQHIRPTSVYLKDMMNYFGKDENSDYNLFKKDDPDAPAVYGQKRIQRQILQNLRNFEEEGFNNKFILLVGPNGSSKSSIVKKIMKGAEEYSMSDEGVLYTFSWIFPINNVVKGTLGLNNKSETQTLNTFAYLDDKDIAAILTSDLKDHPLLLIPVEHRQKIINDFFKDSPKKLEDLQKTYLYRGDLSKRNKMIYDALLKNYKGKHEDVLKHIRVERFVISKRYSSGAVTIEPQLHVDARLQQITMDKRLASLPPSLQSLNLFSLTGEAVLANRGILEFSDLLKRPLDTFKYLLMTMETGTINLAGVLTELDTFFIGTSNEVHFTAFKQHPDFNSFKGRFNFIKVPYLLDYKEEKRIYDKQVKDLSDRTSFEPHSLESIAQFAVMTRIRACMGKHYDDSKLTAIVTGLTPLEKTYLYSKDHILPDRLDTESSQILKHGLNSIISEFENDNLYEGKFGLSPRDIKNIIYKLTDSHKNLTFIEVIEYFGKLIQKKNEYDFLNMSTHGDFHNPSRFLELIKNDQVDKFDKELRDAIGLVDARSYEEYIKKYVDHVYALINKDKIKNNITGKYEEADLNFVKEFEKSIKLKESPEKYRSYLISKLGAWSLDNPGEKLNYMSVFPELVEKLQESFRNDQKKVIKKLTENLLVLQNDQSKNEFAKLSEEIRELYESTLSNLKKMYGYSKPASLKLINFLAKEKKY